MKSIVNSEGLTLTDSPGCFWIFGVFFGVIGIASILTAQINLYKEYPAWQILLIVCLGLSSISAGIYIIYNAPVSRIVISKPNNEIVISHRGLLRKEKQIIKISDIQSVYVLQGKDIDGGPVFTLRFHTIDGRELRVTHLWLHNRENLEGILTLLGEYVSVGNMREKG